MISYLPCLQNKLEPHLKDVKVTHMIVCIKQCAKTIALAYIVQS